MCHRLVNNVVCARFYRFSAIDALLLRQQLVLQQLTVVLLLGNVEQSLLPEYTRAPAPAALHKVLHRYRVPFGLAARVLAGRLLCVEFLARHAVRGVGLEAFGPQRGKYWEGKVNQGI